MYFLLFCIFNTFLHGHVAVHPFIHSFIRPARLKIRPLLYRENTMIDCFPALACADCVGYKSIRSFRTLDGTCNNLKRSVLGAANTPVARVLRASYADGFDTPRGFPGTKPDVPTAHEVSGAVFSTASKNKNNKRDLSTIFMTFGQFLDHDMSFSPHAECKQTNCQHKSSFKYPCFPIKFTRNGHTCSGFGRSAAVCRKREGVRQQLNQLSSYIDGSAMYNNDYKRTQRLRRFDGSGELKMIGKDLLPIELPASHTGCRNPGGCSLAGDARVDENIALHAMHTIWVRHHNVLAKRLKKKHPRWNDNQLFETARKINIAVFQHIVYTEFLPNLVSINRYKKYNPNVNPSIFSGFSSAAFRFGHSLVPNAWAILDKNFDPKGPPISLQESFFNTKRLRKDGIENLVFGLLANQSQTVDTVFAHDLARRLFVQPGQNEHADLTALNIQRGRDHGVPTYGRWRKFCGLKPLKSFTDLRGIIPWNIVKKFQKIYKHPNDIDLFAAGIAENHRNGKILGETFQCIIKKQFERVRDGDRYFYRNPGVFTGWQMKSIKMMTFSGVLCETIKGMVSIQKDAFKTGPYIRRYVCDSMPKINIDYWL